ncbi:MFS transporter [Saccharopolyspora hordei]|uniref:MFS transporter n=1 Tax=Saccharopolyspora hordei TaxID=1838 RepID=UPI0036D230DA
MGARRWDVVALCFAVALLDGFDTRSIACIGPSIADEFGLSPGDMAWVITASTIGRCLGAMLLGALSDRWGRRRTVLVALGLSGGFSARGSVAQTPEQVVALRVPDRPGHGWRHARAARADRGAQPAAPPRHVLRRLPRVHQDGARVNLDAGAAAPAPWPAPARRAGSPGTPVTPAAPPDSGTAPASAPRNPPASERGPQRVTPTRWSPGAWTSRPGSPG